MRCRIESEGRSGLPVRPPTSRQRVAHAAGRRGLSAHLLAQLDDLHREQGGDRSVVERVRAAVADSRCDGVPGKAEAASRLAMSERTLHRRLADHDATFQQVTDEVRLDIACLLAVPQPVARPGLRGPNGVGTPVDGRWPSRRLAPGVVVGGRP